MPVARQRVAKHIPAEAYASNNRSIARQRSSKLALSKIQTAFRGVRSEWIKKSRVPKLAVCGRIRKINEGVQRSTTKYNGVILRKEDFIYTAVMVKLL
jgi:hypothetical protein